jgi:hypothetical protein
MVCENRMRSPDEPWNLAAKAMIPKPRRAGLGYPADMHIERNALRCLAYSSIDRQAGAYCLKHHPMSQAAVRFLALCHERWPQEKPSAPR